jgi:hypothetical protein
VLSLFSSRRNWDSPNPTPAGAGGPPPGGGGTLAGVRGVGRVQILTRGHTLGTLYKYILFGTDSDQNRMLEEIPRSGSDSLGIRAPYVTRRKRRYEANQVWMNTTFFSQGPQSWGKLAVET